MAGRIAAVATVAAALSVAGGLALAGCAPSSSLAPASAPGTTKATAAPPRTPAVTGSATATAQPAASGPAFTVSGDRPVGPNDSQATAATTPGTACDSAQLAQDVSTGRHVVDGFTLAGLSVSAALLEHFLAGKGTAVDYPAGSSISRLALTNSSFLAVNEQVQAAIRSQLQAGATKVTLGAAQLPLPAFSTPSSDLYWGFRGTQGLTVTGRGARDGGRYVGTLTYVIRDSYGFPATDTLAGFGPPMRYLQTACGAPQHSGGARWFPDSIAVTVPFDQPA